MPFPIPLPDPVTITTLPLTACIAAARRSTGSFIAPVSDMRVTLRASYAPLP